ncbi:MAG TPA: sodium/proton-translocating pyrophosphatase [Polyangiaceae bacterium]|nr:sodium/proton-translocating pyrophosphatase [Polyangiaceae bacterium]
MTELVLILGINLAGLTFATAMARWMLVREAPSVEVRRLVNAVERATRSFLAACFRQVAITVALVALVLAGLHAYVWRSGTSENVRYVVWSLLGLAVGALLTCVVAHVVVTLSRRASMNCLGALRVGLDRTLGVAVRAGGAAALVSECTGVLGACLLFGLLRALTTADKVPVASSLAYVLGGYALGAALAALVLQRSGAVYHSASEVGGELAGERDADLGACDPQNPAAVAKLVGDHVGQVAARAVDLFVCSAVANTAVLLTAAHVFSDALAAGSLGLLLLPLLVKSFGVIASAFGIMVIRTEEATEPTHGVWRGHATTLVISIGALLGSTLWLLGKQTWAPFFVAGLLGLLVSTAAAYLATRNVQRRRAPMRSLLEAMKLGDSGVLAEGVALGLSAALVPSVAAFGAVVASSELGRASEIGGGAMLGVSLALMSMLAAGPFMLAVNIVGPIAEGARGLGTLALPSTGDDELERRIQRLQDLGTSTDSFAQSFWTLVGGIAALFTASSLLAPALAAEIAQPSKAGAAAPLPLDLTHPAVAYSGLLGAVLVLAYAGGVLHAASRSLKSVVSEVERQLRAFPKDRGKFQIPSDYIPSYRACIEIVARGALARPIGPVLTAVLFPIVLGPLLVASTTSTPITVRAALASFVLVGAITGLCVAFFAETLRGCLGYLRRQVRSKPGTDTALHARGLAELCGATAGPAAQLAYKTAAVAALAVAPFLS